MNTWKRLLLALVSAFTLYACAYIVVPEVEDVSTPAASQGWTAFVTGVGQSATGDLHVDITIRNDTGDWSAMQATPDKPAVLTTADGKTTNCGTVFLGTGGHRLAPGFQMRGYTAGTKMEPVIQLIYVECAGVPVQAAAGASLSINYTYYTGPYDYFYPENNKASGMLQLKLDEVVADLTYPVGVAVEGLSIKPGVEITAINNNVLVLTEVKRTEEGFEFLWQNYNPTDYPLKVNIGIPPVIGDDGILYGFYQSPDLASPPLTPSKDKAQWATKVAVPPNVKGCYILLSVETGKQRYFVNYAVDITDR
jgi:hypothetical protein